MWDAFFILPSSAYINFTKVLHQPYLMEDNLGSYLLLETFAHLTLPDIGSNAKMLVLFVVNFEAHSKDKWKTFSQLTRMECKERHI